jgi:hypothetical protein
MWGDFCSATLPERIKQWERKSPLEKSLFWAAQKGRFFFDRKFRS